MLFVKRYSAKSRIMPPLTLDEYLPYAFGMLENNDTGAKIQSAIYRKMSPAEKWAVVKDIYATAWSLKAAGLRRQHPEWSEDQVQDAVKEIFLYATT